MEIEFMTAQIEAEPDNYSSANLERSNEKIAFFKQKAEIVELELSKRSSRSVD
ncbi:MAG: hypothetical protein ACHQ1H_15140 [Nitrososphaerales archaeon]